MEELTKRVRFGVWMALLKGSKMYQVHFCLLYRHIYYSYLIVLFVCDLKKARTKNLYIPKRKETYKQAIPAPFSPLCRLVSQSSCERTVR